MAIHFVTGRPGAGKGLYSMKLLIEEIRGTNRAIVTNMALLPEKLAEYLHNEWGESFDLLTRLRLIEDEEMVDFYTYRAPGADQLEVEKDSKGKAVSYDIAAASAGGGVFYLLDEVHLAFGARDWMNTGRATMYYASQHRKLGDDVILVTQAPKNVESQFRSLAQDYTTIRNHGLEKILFFKQPKMFSRQTFLNLPTGGNEKPLEKAVFRMDKKSADCFDTAQGVGIHERGATADKDKDRRKGISWMWILLVVAVVAVGFGMLPKLFKYVVGEFAGGGQRAIEESVHKRTGKNTAKQKAISPGVSKSEVPGASDSPSTNNPVKTPVTVAQVRPTIAPATNQARIVPLPLPKDVPKVIDSLKVIGVKPRFLGEDSRPTFFTSDGKRMEFGEDYEFFDTEGIQLFNGDRIPYSIRFNIRTIFPR